MTFKEQKLGNSISNLTFNVFFKLYFLIELIENSICLKETDESLLIDMIYFDRFLINIIKYLKGSKFNAGERSWYTLLENKDELIEQLFKLNYV